MTLLPLTKQAQRPSCKLPALLTARSPALRALLNSAFRKSASAFADCCSPGSDGFMTCCQCFVLSWEKLVTLLLHPVRGRKQRGCVPMGDGGGSGSVAAPPFGWRRAPREVRLAQSPKECVPQRRAKREAHLGALFTVLPLTDLQLNASTSGVILAVSSRPFSQLSQHLWPRILPARGKQSQRFPAAPGPAAADFGDCWAPRAPCCAEVSLSPGRHACDQ